MTSRAVGSGRVRRTSASVRAGALATVPLLLPVLAFGLSFGVLARSAGFSPFAATAMSATTFAGAAQFAAAGILDTGGTVAAAIAAAVLLNARYVAMGLAIAPAIHGGFVRRFLTAQLVVDESWAISQRDAGRFDRGRLVGSGLVLFAGWVSSTMVGALGAEFVADPEALGLDAAFPALFLALLWPQLSSRRAIAAAALGASIALVLMPFTPPGMPIIGAALGSLVGLRRR